MYHLGFTSIPNCLGVLLTECQAPLSNSFIGNNDTPSCKDFFDIAEAQRKAEVQPHGMADDLCWIAIT